MSSLAATQADGYYVPPEYYESGQYKHKGRNQFAGSKGHNQYLQRGVVRFELPYDGFCNGCGAHVGKGTRFNAHKSRNGHYFTTPIYKFNMTCRICAKIEFVIQTNPKERSFDYVEGIHKQVQEFDPVEAGTAGVIDTDYGNKLIPATGGGSTSNDGSTSALNRLETVASGQRKAMTEHDQLQSLLKVNAQTFYDDAASNAAVRSAFRVDRTNKKRRLSEGKALGWHDGIELLGATIDETAEARSTCFGNGKDAERQRFRKIKTSSIFTDTTSKRRRSRKRRSSKEAAQPDGVASSVRSDLSVSLHAASLIMQKAACNVEKKRIRISASKSGLVVQQCTAEKLPCEVEKPQGLVTLMADYDSDSD